MPVQEGDRIGPAHHRVFPRDGDGAIDQIRTKHEVKAFVESGDQAGATTLMQRAAQRREVGENHTMKATLRRGQQP